MIHYFCTQKHDYTLRSYLESYGHPISKHIRICHYTGDRRLLPRSPGVYIFSDLERLSSAQLEVLGAYWEELASLVQKVWLLNHPLHVIRRYEMLRMLYEEGINPFNVYRLTEYRMPERYPVFIRDEAEHGARLMPARLLANPVEYRAAIEQLVREGRSREGLLAVEHCDVSKGQGLYHKMSAMVLGDTIVPIHRFESTDWLIKEPKVVDESAVNREMQYLRNNSCSAQLRAVAKLANIQYGRIDFSIVDEKPVIWEINTNPHVLTGADVGLPARKAGHELVARRYNAAMRQALWQPRKELLRQKWAKHAPSFCQMRSAAPHA